MSQDKSMSDQVKKVAWGIMGMIPYNQELHERLGMPAYVRNENYLFINKKCENLEAENERLRKAGDDLFHALAGMHLVHRGSIDTTKQKDLIKWTAAKEGRPNE